MIGAPGLISSNPSGFSKMKLHSFYGRDGMVGGGGGGGGRRPSYLIETLKRTRS